MMKYSVDYIPSEVILPSGVISQFPTQPLALLFVWSSSTLKENNGHCNFHKWLSDVLKYLWHHDLRYFKGIPLFVLLFSNGSVLSVSDLSLGTESSLNSSKAISFSKREILWLMLSNFCSHCDANVERKSAVRVTKWFTNAKSLFCCKHWTCL